MCGIAGFCNNTIDRVAVISAMNARMLHRGPDAGDYWLDENSGWTFGHRRLSIVDLTETGAQPMHSASGRFVICYNGEIYNASEVRDKLLAEGHVTAFRGTSDTEILLEAFEAYGVKKAISMCKGMFAIALYDKQEKTLSLLRDRVGEKPLYYGFVNGYFAFASDPALFRELPGFTGEINRDALAQFMRYCYIPAPLSIYEGIYKVKPGEILTMKVPFQEYVTESYWSMEEAALEGERNPFTGSEEEAREELERLLTDSIRGQMIADVPFGAFLSGGIDSPLIVSLMQKISKEPVKTFTIGFDDPKYNEAQFAKEIAEHLGTDHTELYLSEKELIEAIPKMPYYFAEPFGDSSMIPTYFVSKLARSKVTVSLSGDAGDELFCGYSNYWKSEALWQKLSRVPKSLRNVAGNVAGYLPCKINNTVFRGSECLKAVDIAQLQEAVCNRQSDYVNHLVPDVALPELSKYHAILSDVYTEMQLRDMLDYHPDDILVKVDRAGMAVSLENRVPMLDRDVVEFAWRIPSAYKYRDGISKKILKDILYQYVPKTMLDRPKKGFSVPLKKWLSEGETSIWASDLLEHSKLAEDGYLDQKVILKLWNHFHKTKENDRLLWNILMAEQWYQENS
ncbi:MAG: asparagine synthase (glutamine-hydrolyzing) [Lachnospiraceae bacterium]|nr:asparagine synthase (glutamine-hydrolyzing) [Lachnospiraceae bacterium]